MVHHAFARVSRKPPLAGRLLCVGANTVFRQTPCKPPPPFA
jgi:hypothetical protein